MERRDKGGTTGRILEELARPEAFSHETGAVTVIQTHISMVFLAGPCAYKVKKAVTLDFLDFGTPQLRRRFCHEEVRLNRRLAPSVYHGVVPIVAAGSGGAGRTKLKVLDRIIESPEEEVPGAVDWAVRMTRLPEERTLKALLRRGSGGEGEPHENPEALLERLADLLADFHARAERGPRISSFASYPAVARNATDNFDELERAVGSTISAAVHRRLRELSGQALERLRPRVERRARDDVACDTHGDLRLGHVYALADALVVVDCIEFDERFRYADPVADVAFLVMELEFEDRPDLALAFADRYAAASGDGEVRRLLPWYASYRDIVRGKVRTLQSDDRDVPAKERTEAADRAVRHFLRALGRLAPPDERPCLVLVAGLPGTGKSTLARALALKGGFTWIDTDRVRKRLAAGGVAASGGTAAAFEEGIYTAAWTDRTYEACLREGDGLLFEGARVLVEGSFRTERHRARFLDAARARGVPALLLLCEVDRAVVRDRLARRRDDASDADWGVYEEAERRWEEPPSATGTVLVRLRGDGPPASVLRAAEQALMAQGLL